MRTTGITAAAGIGLFALSFVPGWIVHHRELTGEGYRTVDVVLGAWRDVAMPVLPLAAVLVLAVALLALTRARARLLVVGSAAVLGLLVASAWPLAHGGHVSHVTLSAGPLLIVGIGLGLVMVVGSFVQARPSSTAVMGATAIGVLALAFGVGGRTFGLQLDEGDNRDYADGSYVRQATDGEATETLTIRDATYVIADRWSGNLEGSGITIVLTDDAACPGVRGAYHTHPVDGDGLRFVKVSDTCADGAREHDLETGTWARDP